LTVNLSFGVTPGKYILSGSCCGIQKQEKIAAKNRAVEIAE